MFLGVGEHIGTLTSKVTLSIGAPVCGSKKTTATSCRAWLLMRACVRVGEF